MEHYSFGVNESGRVAFYREPNVLHNVTMRSRNFTAEERVKMQYWAADYARSFTRRAGVNVAEYVAHDMWRLGRNCTDPLMLSLASITARCTENYHGEPQWLN